MWRWDLELQSKLSASPPRLVPGPPTARPRPGSGGAVVGESGGMNDSCPGCQSWAAMPRLLANVAVVALASAVRWPESPGHTLGGAGWKGFALLPPRPLTSGNVIWLRAHTNRVPVGAGGVSSMSGQLARGRLRARVLGRPPGRACDPSRRSGRVGMGWKVVWGSVLLATPKAPTPESQPERSVLSAELSARPVWKMGQPISVRHWSSSRV